MASSAVTRHAAGCAVEKFGDFAYQRQAQPGATPLGGLAATVEWLEDPLPVLLGEPRSRDQLEHASSARADMATEGVGIGSKGRATTESMLGPGLSLSVSQDHRPNLRPCRVADRVGASTVRVAQYLFLSLSLLVLLADVADVESWKVAVVKTSSREHKNHRRWRQRGKCSRALWGEVLGAMQV